MVTRRYCDCTPTLPQLCSLYSQPSRSSTLILPFIPSNATRSSSSLLGERVGAVPLNSNHTLSQSPSGDIFKKRRLARRERYEQYRRSIVRHLSFKAETKDPEVRTMSYTCSLCHFSLLGNSEPYRLPVADRDGVGRIFCEDCWVWIWNLAICWTCGEIVGREEEKIGFGWCWWHWGCLNCMICRVKYPDIRPM